MKKGCRIKHSTFLTLDSSALVNTHYPKKFVSSAHWVCHKPVMFPRQKHVRVSLISCALGFSLPAQESPQGTPAVPKCIQLVQVVLMCFGSHGHAPCRRHGRDLSAKSSNCAETKFPAEESGLGCHLTHVHMISRLIKSGLQWQVPLGLSFIKQQQNSGMRGDKVHLCGVF